MDKMFLKKDLVTGYTLTPDGVLAYIALRKIMGESILLINKTSTVDCISLNKMAYTLIGTRKTYENALLDALHRGICELEGANALTVVQWFGSSRSYEFVIDFTNLYLDLDNENYVMISPDEVHKILACNEVMKKKISMLKYFIALISTFDWSKSLKCMAGLPNLQGKIGHMSQDFIATQADISERTCQRYNDTLSELKMIYVYRSNDKVRVGDKLKQIKNCYSRYEDKDVCEEYASNYENFYGCQHKIVYTQKKKSQADNNRRLAAIYNRICEGYGDDYDEDTVKEVYKYIVNKNKALQKEIDKKYAQTEMTASDKAWVEKLQSQLRGESIFEQYDFLNRAEKSADEWGEVIDFSNDNDLDSIFA